MYPEYISNYVIGRDGGQSTQPPPPPIINLTKKILNSYSPSKDSAIKYHYLYEINLINFVGLFLLLVSLN